MSDPIRAFLGLSFADVSIGDIGIILLCVVCAVALDHVIQHFLTKTPKALEGDRMRKHQILFGSLRKPLHVFFMTIGCGLGLVIIDTPPWGIDIFNHIFVIMRAIVIWCVIWYLLLLTREFSDYFVKRAAKTESKVDDMIVPLISGIVKVLLVAIGLLLVLQNLGFSITSLVAGLGIGSAAIALAAKDTLANFFGSLVVFFDHPFDIGDWISLNGVEGTVEEIRLRTTIIRTAENSVIMMPNQMLTNTYIDNFERRKCRKMDCSFGVLYSTTQPQLETIICNIKEHLAKHPDIYAPSFYVAFSGFGASSLDVTCIAYTNRTSKAEHLADKQNFMFEIMRIVEAAGSGFAFPTQTIDWAAGSEQNPFHFVQKSIA